MGIPSFKAGMMFVGWRNRDWKLVYYQPYQGDEGSDEETSVLTPSLYFTNAAGDEDAMMEGEVLFLPHFAFENCETKTRGEKKAMQIQELMRAHALYNEMDPETYHQEMEAAERPHFRRWASIMTDIRRWKDHRMRQKETRRTRRVARLAELRRAGVPENELDANMSDTDESTSATDSGFEDENEVRMYSRRSRRGPMNPPPDRRPPSGNGNSDNNPRPRKRRRPAARQPSAGLQMSGVWQDSLDYDPNPPERSTSQRPLQRNRSNSTGLFVGGRESLNERRERLGRLSGHMQPTVEDDDDGEDDEPEPGAAVQDAAETYNGGLTEQEALEQAIRASQPPENHTQMDVAQSTEDDDDDDDDNDGLTVLGDGTAWRASNERSRSRSVSHASNG